MSRNIARARRLRDQNPTVVATMCHALNMRWTLAIQQGPVVSWKCQRSHNDAMKNETQLENVHPVNDQ